MPPVFRELPPPTLICELCTLWNLGGMDDSKAFLKESVHLDELQVLLPQLEPYYIPCKARDFLYSNLTPTRALTILRHCLKAHGRLLDSFEKSTHGKRLVWYRILPKHSEEESDTKDICVEFT